MILSYLFTDPAYFFIWVVAVIIGLTFHEFSHVWTAYIQGDSTGEAMGRLTLNPLAHIDWIGFLMLVTIGFGWGKAAPFNPYNLKNKKWGPALVAIAGPLSNALLILIFGIILYVIVHFTGLAADNYLVIFLVCLIQINLILGLFNLLPIPPLDGSKILYAFLPVSAAPFIITLERYGFIILMVFLIFFSNFFFMLFNVFYDGIISIIL